MESLLNADRRLANRRDEDNRLPLHWAASYNRLSIVEILAEQKSFDIDAQDGSGWTALQIASSLKDADALVDFLLSKGADTNVKTNNGQTALHFAASKSNLDTARKLIAHKATARVKDKRGAIAASSRRSGWQCSHHQVAAREQEPHQRDGYGRVHCSASRHCGRAR